MRSEGSRRDYSNVSLRFPPALAASASSLSLSLFLTLHLLVLIKHTHTAEYQERGICSLAPKILIILTIRID